jgi:acetylornithine deacetylase/succinyl-diaminopimelate desuccinylase-like protein
MSQDVITLLQQLVRIPSVNPDNAPGTSETGEEMLAIFLSGWLESIGADVSLEEIKPGRPNLIARFAPLDGRPRILLGPHLDTVGVGGMTIEPFGGKSATAACGAAGRATPRGRWPQCCGRCMKTAIGSPSCPWRWISWPSWARNPASGAPRSFVKRHGADYSFALVGEPTSMEIVHVTKGSLWATLRATGKAAHSSMPERGENAILKLTRALDRLDCHLGAELAGFTHPVLGHSTLNIGVIRGGARPEHRARPRGGGNRHPHHPVARRGWWRAQGLPKSSTATSCR